MLLIPIDKSYTFNKRLLKYRHRGYEPYSPGNIQNRFDYETKEPSFDQAYKFSQLIWLYKGVDIWKKHKPYPIVRATDNEDYDIDIHNFRDMGPRYVQLSPDQRIRQIEAGLLIPERRDVLYDANKYDLIFDAHVRLLPLFWISIDPGTQITGTFNPTHVNYFGPIGAPPLRIKDPVSELGALIQKLHVPVISDIIEEYKGHDVEDLMFFDGDAYMDEDMHPFRERNFSAINWPQRKRPTLEEDLPSWSEGDLPIDSEDDS